MKKSIRTTLAKYAVAVSTGATLISGKVLAAASGASGGVSGGANAARGDSQPSDLFGNTGIFTQVTNTILFIVGALSVIMLIYGGLRYIISGGDSKKVTDAKNTIMYAIIGLIIAVLSYAIINFVIRAFADQGGGGNLDV
ncbi:MAG: pilin [Candidatus Nomurabacteria bacterium]|jgi:cytochrome bd-type quinol oxidase subunit 2|nr:pilin [Candidatus Nomurabacteria bacterium]